MEQLKKLVRDEIRLTRFELVLLFSNLLMTLMLGTANIMIIKQASATRSAQINDFEINMMKSMDNRTVRRDRQMDDINQRIDTMVDRLHDLESSISKVEAKGTTLPVEK